MRPPKGKLLEVAWGVASASDLTLGVQESHIISLGEDRIPQRIQQLTGIHQELLETAIPEEQLFIELNSLAERHQVNAAIIHYSQFEYAFFSDLFQRYQNDKKLPFEILCSALIAKKLFPALPSGNIRAVAGYFGSSVHEFKRAAYHVEATFQIWKTLAPELEKNGLLSVAKIQSWLSEKIEGKKKAVPYEYRIDRLTRLSFPDRPGIYKMLNKNSEVLYVGKATSLKSRVNSYFRGQKGRDRKKLEMLSQVWNIEYAECGTPLEAALLESDEIKRLNPPYNILLKNNRSAPVFYDRNFLTQTRKQDAHHPIGPFRPTTAIEALRLLCSGLLQSEILQVFYDEVPEDLLALGFTQFCANYNIDLNSLVWVRNCIAIGLRLVSEELKIVKDHQKNEDTDESETNTAIKHQELTVDDVAGKFYRLFKRAAQEYRRARRLTQILNAKIEWTEKQNTYSILVQNGKITKSTILSDNEISWSGLDLGDYDRMSVLLSEIEKHSHKIIPFKSSDHPQSALF